MRKTDDVPAEESESDGQDQGLEPDAGVEVVEGGVMRVPVARLRDGEPRVLRVELRQVAHLLQVPLHVHQDPLHRRPDRT